MELHKGSSVHAQAGGNPSPNATVRLAAPRISRWLKCISSPVPIMPASFFSSSCSSCSSFASFCSRDSVICAFQKTCSFWSSSACTVLPCTMRPSFSHNIYSYLRKPPNRYSASSPIAFSTLPACFKRSSVFWMGSAFTSRKHHADRAPKISLSFASRNSISRSRGKSSQAKK